MVKAYRAYNATRFPSGNTYKVASQSNFLDIELPETTISRIDLLLTESFQAYYIHHEMIVEQIGRAKDIQFTHFAAPFEFNSYIQRASKLLLFQTAKRVCIDLVHRLNSSNDFDINQYSVDFEVLRPYIKNVRGAWIKFQQANLRTSAHFGNHVDNSLAFQESMQTGQLTSLYILYDYESEQIPIQITSDCAVVLYPNIDEVQIEIDITVSVINWLHSTGALSLATPRKPRKRRMISTSGGQTTENPPSLLEVLEENEL